MDYNSVPQVIPNCSGCGCHRTAEEFFRRGAFWKTCNRCSDKATARRKKETSEAGRALDLRTSQVRINQQQAVDYLLQLHEEYAARQRQQQVQEYFGNERQQWAQQTQQMWLNSSTDNPAAYKPSTLQLNDQSRQLMHQTQHPVDTQTFHANTAFEEPMFYLNTQSELSLQPSQTYSPLDVAGYSNGGIQPYPQNPDVKFYENRDAPADTEQFGFEAELAYNFEQWFDKEFSSFDQSEPLEAGQDLYGMATPIAMADLRTMADLHTMTDPDAMDIEVIDYISPVLQDYAASTQPSAFQLQPGAPKRPARKQYNGLPNVDVDAYFADFFIAAEDVLNQPTTPGHDLKGEALAKHLIKEIALATRLLTLHGYLSPSRARSTDEFFDEVKTMARNEQLGLNTPWGPLSDWLTIFEVEYEDLLERYGFGNGVSSIKELEWKAKNKFKAEKISLMKVLREDLAKEGKMLIERNAQKLLETLIELTGEPNIQAVTAALKRKLRQMRVPGSAQLFAEQAFMGEIIQGMDVDTQPSTGM